MLSVSIISHGSVKWTLRMSCCCSTRFVAALEAGQKPLADILQKSEKSGSVSGADAFLLYDTYGFPLEITLDAAADKGVKVFDSPSIILERILLFIFTFWRMT